METTNTPFAMKPSSQRPIPLVARADLVVQEADYLGTGYFVVKDPVSLKYYRFQKEQYQLLLFLDGKRSIEEIREEFHKKFPTVRLSPQDIQNIVTDLHRLGLAYSTRRGQGAKLVDRDREDRRKKIWNALRNLFYLKLPGWDPEHTLRAIHPYFRWLYTPWAVALCALLVLSSWILLAVHFREFHSRLPGFYQFFGWPNLLYLWLVLGISKIIHEFGHGLTCKHFGGECHEMGVLLLVLSPCLYCDVTDSWLVKNKWKRIMIGAAGMYIEIVLSAFAIFGWWNSQPGLFHYLCLNLFFVTTVSTVIFNANPLLRYDGYYMMSDWLEIPNLRAKADRIVQQQFASICFGIKSKSDPFMPKRGHAWFASYAIASWLYRWMVMVGVFLFLYTFLKPYRLQSIGIGLAFWSLGTLGYSMIRGLIRTLSTPRSEPMSFTRTSLTFATFASLVVAILFIPIPWNIEAPLQIQPQGIQHVYNPVGGKLLDILVQPGDRVVAEQPLAILFDPDLGEKETALRFQLRQVEEEIETARMMRDPSGERLAKERKTSIESQLRDLVQHKSLLTLRAPCDGFVITAPRRSAPKHDRLQIALPGWSGTPLTPANKNCFLEPRTHLCSVAPSRTYEAILFIDQLNRNDIQLGNDVRIRLEAFPTDKFHSKIETIANRHADFAPQSLSTKASGDLATLTDQHGNERLARSAYQAIVPIETDLPIQSGLRGRARVTLETKTAGQWLWQGISETITFRL